MRLALPFTVAARYPTVIVTLPEVVIWEGDVVPAGIVGGAVSGEKALRVPRVIVDPVIAVITELVGMPVPVRTIPTASPVRGETFVTMLLGLAVVPLRVPVYTGVALTAVIVVFGRMPGPVRMDPTVIGLVGAKL
jgi:hypothetical protein